MQTIKDPTKTSIDSKVNWANKTTNIFSNNDIFETSKKPTQILKGNNGSSYRNVNNQLFKIERKNESKVKKDLTFTTIYENKQKEELLTFLKKKHNSPKCQKEIKEDNARDDKHKLILYDDNNKVISSIECIIGKTNNSNEKTNIQRKSFLKDSYKLAPVEKPHKTGLGKKNPESKSKTKFKQKIAHKREELNMLNQLKREKIRKYFIQNSPENEAIKKDQKLDNNIHVTTDSNLYDIMGKKKVIPQKNYNLFKNMNPSNNTNSNDLFETISKNSQMIPDHSIQHAGDKLRNSIVVQIARHELDNQEIYARNHYINSVRFPTKDSWENDNLEKYGKKYNEKSQSYPDKYKIFTNTLHNNNENKIVENSKKRKRPKIKDPNRTLIADGLLELINEETRYNTGNITDISHLYDGGESPLRNLHK